MPLAAELSSAHWAIKAVSVSIPCELDGPSGQATRAYIGEGTGSSFCVYQPEPSVHVCLRFTSYKRQVGGSANVKLTSERICTMVRVEELIGGYSTSQSHHCERPGPNVGEQFPTAGLPVFCSLSRLNWERNLPVLLSSQVLVNCHLNWILLSGKTASRLPGIVKRLCRLVRTPSLRRLSLRVSLRRPCLAGACQCPRLFPRPVRALLALRPGRLGQRSLPRRNRLARLL